MSLSSDINSAVDAAASAPPPESPTTAPESTTSPTLTTEKPLASAPAPRSGSERRSTKPAQPEGATTQPAAPAAASTSTATPGEPPQEKWGTILDNARKDTAKTTREEIITREYDGLTPEDFSQWKPHLAALSADPVAYYHKLGDLLARQGKLQRNGTPAQTRLQQSEPDAMPEPSLVVVGADGQPAGKAYSDEDVRKALRFQESSLMRTIDARLQPFDQVLHEANVAKINANADKDAAQLMSKAKNWEGFNDLRNDIWAIMKENKSLSLLEAWSQAFHEKHLPTLKGKTRAAVLEEIKAAPASSTLDPKQPNRGSGKPDGQQSLEDRFGAALISAGMSRG